MITSPAATGTIRVHEPGMITCPGSSVTPNWATLLASQATAMTGLPSTAPLQPVSTISPFLRSVAPMQCRVDVGRRRVGRPPSTSAADEALSAMVSWILIFQSGTRESTISMDGST